ncbi:MAG: hypothetical protein L0Z62_45315 [Gemmataceae bacterium]|nr:hypothetical protein [Gemmataceae bacterium]
MADLTAESSQEQKLSVAGALRRHRAWLLGVALFPLAVFLAAFLRVEIRGIDREVFLVPFVVVLAPLWDYTRCRAPYTLWIVAMGIWMASICLALL